MKAPLPLNYEPPRTASAPPSGTWVNIILILLLILPILVGLALLLLQLKHADQSSEASRTQHLSDFVIRA